MKETILVKNLRRTIREKIVDIRKLRETVEILKKAHNKDLSYTAANYEQRIMNLNVIYDSDLAKLKKSKREYLILFWIMTAFNMTHLVFELYPF